MALLNRRHVLGLGVGLLMPPLSVAIQNAVGYEDLGVATSANTFFRTLGQTYGVAIFDHPKNLHHPTWWHARDYGLFAANPLGWHDFEPRTTPPGSSAC